MADAVIEAALPTLIQSAYQYSVPGIVIELRINTLEP